MQKDRKRLKYISNHKILENIEQNVKFYLFLSLVINFQRPKSKVRPTRPSTTPRTTTTAAPLNIDLVKNNETLQGTWWAEEKFPLVILISQIFLFYFNYRMVDKSWLIHVDSSNFEIDKKLRSVFLDKTNKQSLKLDQAFILTIIWSWWAWKSQF